VESKKILNKTVCIVGLGYVGLPLAEDFSHHIRTIGYRRDQNKVDELNNIPGNRIEATTDPQRIKEADFVIIAVPTPVTRAKDPDLEPVISASEVVGQHLNKGAIVVLESTVYPGVTEEIMGSILERESGLQCGKDFKIGYSPIFFDSTVYSPFNKFFDIYNQPFKKNVFRENGTRRNG
jgi:UDP-N-acetyl-D-glucosamine/UDP-N-acetyl-D-galactosamine dehydrogenase